MSRASLSTSSADGHLIVPMTEHDLLEVVEIERECKLSRWGWEAYYNEIANGAIMLVARELEVGWLRPVTLLRGFAAARLADDQLHINNLGVRAQFRREGVGRSLLGAVLEKGFREGAQVVHLEVRASNLAAINLYLAQGFKMVGRRARYYADPPEDAILMSRAL